jgi:glycosyltransferase involved in cell wall biosynthesis
VSIADGKRRNPIVRILFIQKSGGPGGSKLSLLSTLRALHETDDLAVLCQQSGDLGEQCRAMGIPVHVGHLPRWRNVLDRLTFGWAMDRIARALSDVHYDWIISNEMWWAPHATQLASRLSARSACILRDTLVAGRKERDYRLGQLHLVLAVSDAIRGTISHPHCHTLYNIVDPPQSDTAIDSKLSALLSRHEAVRRWLLLVGKMEPRKNQLAALDVLRRIREQGHADVGLLLVGGEERAYGGALREACGRMRLADQVVVAGHLPSAGSAFRLATATLCTSQREGLPRVVIESFLSGTPCFSYPLPGIEEILGSWRDVFATEVTGESQLADLVSPFLRQPAEALSAAKQVADRCASRFSSDAHARRLRALLEGPSVAE